MTEKKFDNHNVSAKQMPENAPSLPEKKSSRTLWIVFLLFFAFVITVFLTQERVTIEWIEDYQAGIELAKQQNKPLFIAFYKSYIPSNTKEGIYSNRSIKEFIEARFTPILIDAAEQPEIAKLYNVESYPSHYIRWPDSNDVFGPIGPMRPQDFIGRLKDISKKMGLPDK